MKPIFGLAVATGIYVLALGMIIPILPFQIQNLGGSSLQMTLIYSIFSGASVLTLRFWGLMSDRFGRTPVLWVSVIVTTLSYLWLASVSALWEVYAARALAGAFAAWLPVSQALVSDHVREDKRAPAMGLLGVGFGIGFTLGPALGGALANRNEAVTDFTTPFLIAAVVSALTLLVTLLLVREPKHHNRSAQDVAAHSIWRDRSLLAVLGLYFGVSVLFTGIEGVLAVWGEAMMHWQPKDVGYLLMIAGLGSILAQGWLIRLANRKLREARTALLGIAGLVLTIGVLGFATSTLSVAITLFAIAVCIGLHNPAMQSLISQIAPDAWRGKVLGIAQAVASLARVLGPAWAGLAFEVFGGAIPFHIAFGLSLLLLLIAIPILKPHLYQGDKSSAH